MSTNDDTRPAPVNRLVGLTFIKSEDNSLIYNLRQDGWRKGEPVMVNDIAVSLSNVHDLSRRAIVADIILLALNEVVEYEEDMRAISDRLGLPPNPANATKGGK